MIKFLQYSIISTTVLVSYHAFSQCIQENNDLSSPPCNGIISTNPDNPINDETQVRLNLVSTTGSVVATIIDEYQEVGAHEATYDASYLPVGVYVYTLETKAGKENRRLVLIK
jgi:hypothetical protein